MAADLNRRIFGAAADNFGRLVERPRRGARDRRARRLKHDAILRHGRVERGLTFGGRQRAGGKTRRRRRRRTRPSAGGIEGVCSADDAGALSVAGGAGVGSAASIVTRAHAGYAGNFGHELRVRRHFIAARTSRPETLICAASTPTPSLTATTRR